MVLGGSWVVISGGGRKSFNMGDIYSYPMCHPTYNLQLPMNLQVEPKSPLFKSSSRCIDVRGGHGLGVSEDRRPPGTQSAQYPLIKECTLN